MLIVENENEVRITLDLNTIGYIARAKRDDKHAPSITSQHAECIRPYGELIGFGHRRGAATGGNLCRSWNLIDMNRNGTTYEVEDLVNHVRCNPVPQSREDAKKMISADVAKELDFMSAVLIINTPSESTALEFVRAWESLKENPKSFNIVGGNCAMRSHEMFVKSGIVKRGSGILTPNQLFHYLARSLENKKGYTVRKFFGYIGFEKTGTSGYDLIIKF